MTSFSIRSRRNQVFRPSFTSPTSTSLARHAEQHRSSVRDEHLSSSHTFPVGRGKTCAANLCGHCSHLIGPDPHDCESHHQEWRAFREGGGMVRELVNVEPFKGR